MSYDSELDDDFSSLCCPITLTLMIDPVILTGDGHTYEREAIENWLASNNTSPATNASLPKGSQVIPNHALRGAISEVRTKQGRAGSEGIQHLTAKVQAAAIAKDPKAGSKPPTPQPSIPQPPSSSYSPSAPGPASPSVAESKFSYDEETESNSTRGLLANNPPACVPEAKRQGSQGFSKLGESYLVGAGRGAKSTFQNLEVSAKANYLYGDTKDLMQTPPPSLPRTTCKLSMGHSTNWQLARVGTMALAQSAVPSTH